MESAKYTIKEAVQAIQELDFGEDTCNINQYIKKRMQNNDISEIINMEKQDISPAVYHILQNSQPTSASVEISFSMLKNLLLKFPLKVIAYLKQIMQFKGRNIKLLKKED